MCGFDDDFFCGWVEGVVGVVYDDIWVEFDDIGYCVLQVDCWIDGQGLFVDGDF